MINRNNVKSYLILIYNMQAIHPSKSNLKSEPDSFRFLELFTDTFNDYSFFTSRIRGYLRRIGRYIDALIGF